MLDRKLNLDDSSEKRVIEQFFLNFLTCSSAMSVSKNTKKKTGHRACFRDMMGQNYPIYACTDTNHVRHFIVWGTFCGNGGQGS